MQPCPVQRVLYRVFLRQVLRILWSPDTLGQYRAPRTARVGDSGVDLGRNLTSPCTPPRASHGAVLGAPLPATCGALRRACAWESVLHQGSARSLSGTPSPGLDLGSALTLGGRRGAQQLPASVLSHGLCASARASLNRYPGPHPAPCQSRAAQRAREGDSGADLLVAHHSKRSTV
eukprot:3799770-Rhodomonas_salina.1